MKRTRRHPPLSRFKDAQDIYETLGGFLVEIVSDEELSHKFCEADTVVRYEYTDPDALITVSTLKGQPCRVEFGQTQTEPEVVFRMKADTANRFWLGRMNGTKAVARGEVSVKGPANKVLKLAPLLGPTFPLYRARLESAGRTELLRG